MGTSDRTCAVSHLPIQYGDPCRFVFLRQTIPYDEELDPGDWKHVWTQWLPMSLPVKGLYDGYGRVMSPRPDAVYDPDPVLKFQIESIARVAEPVPEEEKRGLSELDDFPNTIESLMTACERGWLRVRMRRPLPEEGQTHYDCRVSPFYVSERAWRAMTASAKDGGIGSWRSRMESLHEGLIDSLRRVVDHHRERRRGDRKDADEGSKRALLEVDPLMIRIRRNLGPEFEQAPDILVVGGDWAPEIQLCESLYDFKEEDWIKFNEIVVDLNIFFATLKHELRREVHPELYSDQFYLPDTSLDAHKVLAAYLQQWCVEIEDSYEREGTMCATDSHDDGGLGEVT